MNLKGWTPLQEAQLSGIYEAEQMLWGLSGLNLESIRVDSDSDSGLYTSDAAVRAEELVKAIRVDDVEAVSGILGLSGGQEEDGEPVLENLALEARNQGGRSPLQQALLFGSLKVARWLLERVFMRDRIRGSGLRSIMPRCRGVLAPWNCACRMEQMCMTRLNRNRHPCIMLVDVVQRTRSGYCWIVMHGRML
jgi:hypothetical protein